MICPYCHRNVYRDFQAHVDACKFNHKQEEAERERLRVLHAHQLPLGPNARPLKDEVAWYVRDSRSAPIPIDESKCAE